MKTVIGVSQFVHQNEPKLAALIGNLGLLFAFIAGIPALCQEAGIIVLPVLVATIVKYSILGGMICKFATKFFGTVDGNNVPTSTTLQSTITTIPVPEPAK